MASDVFPHLSLTNSTTKLSSQLHNLSVNCSCQLTDEARLHRRHPGSHSWSLPGSQQFTLLLKPTDSFTQHLLSVCHLQTSAACAWSWDLNSSSASPASGKRRVMWQQQAGTAATGAEDMLKRCRGAGL